MADYNINKSDGTAVVVPTGGISNQFDIPLLGQDAINYGDDLATAQLRQLENFANSTAPSFGANRTIGQLWYDTTAGQGLKIWDGGTWDLLPLDTNLVHLTGAELIAGVKTFSSSAAFTSASVPFTVNSTTLVTNLNAHALEGRAWSWFANATQGALADTAAQLPSNSAGAGYILSADLSDVYTWVPPTAGTGNVDPADLAGAPGSNYVLLATAATGDQQPQTDVGITYTASTTTLAVANFSGALNGNAATATLATNATTASIATTITVADTESAGTFVVLAGGATGNQAPLTDEGLQYNASSDTLGTALVTNYLGVGTALSALTADNITAGTLAVARGGTNVTTATGTGTAFALHNSPVFVTEITTPLVANSGAIGIEYNNSVNLQTQLHTTSGNTSGATVRTHGNTLVDIGFNVLPVFNWDANDTIEAQHCGHMTGTSDGGSYTLTLTTIANVDFPIGGVCTIVNGGATDYTITEGADTTLFYLEGGVGGTDTTGGCVVGAGGVATLYRFDATDYFIWGSEITP